MLGGNVITWLLPVAKHVLDLLLPPNCLACDAPVDADGQFCLDCFRQANFISAPLCRQCGVPLPFGAAGGAGGCCEVCAAVPPAFHEARAALRYDALSQLLILPFKHGDRTEAARGLALLMARAGAKLLEGAELLVPVPCTGTGCGSAVITSRPCFVGRWARLRGARFCPMHWCAGAPQCRWGRWASPNGGWSWTAPF